MIDDTVCCHGRPITCMECIADERAERDNKWREAFNRSEQFQTGPIERAERAEAALRDISELLSDAGCQAQPIGSAVIELRDRADRNTADLVALRARCAALEAEHARLKKALVDIVRACYALHGDPEDCDDCADLDGMDDPRPCAIHRSVPFYRAVLAAEESLGPCPCGHLRSQHDDEDSTRCRECECGHFTIPGGAR